MPFPRRTFTADEGQPSTGAAGPDAIEYDLDNAFAMFDPTATLRTGEPGGIDANENIRDVQVDQNQKPNSDAGKIPTLLSGIVNRIKAIMGTPDWKNDPPTTLAGLSSQIGNVTVNQNATPQGDTGNIQQLLSWIVNRIRAITGRGDWKEDPAVNLQVLSEAATHEDISYHALSKTTHGVQSPYYIAKTSRSDQLPSWNDIPDKPTTFPVGPHQHSAQDIITGQLPPERIGNLPASKITSGQFSPDLIPNLPASKITSGTFDKARLPAASTSQPGIVQLTNSRSSTSETLAVTAAALNAHRMSADHDERYYTKSQIDSLLGELSTFHPAIRNLLLSYWILFPSGTTSDLRGVAYGNGLWVVTETFGTILTSTNGTSWTSRSTGTSRHLIGVAYANGLWVAVGYDGTIMTSTNGTSWTSRSSGPNHLIGVAYGNGLWVAVGEGGTILTSPDGTTWTSRSSGTSDDLLGVTYGNGLWVAVGESGTILTSTDGTSWTSWYGGTLNHLRGVAYANGLWVVAGTNGTLMTSTNGTSWTSRSSGTSADLQDVAYGNGLWVAVGGGGTLLTSTNGISWTRRTSSTSSNLYGVAYANGLWVAVGESGTISSTHDIGA